MRKLPEPRCPTCGQSVYVPLSVRSNSRVVTWLWVRGFRWILHYNRATRLAKRLP